MALQPSCAFRRFLYDGGAVARLEIGLQFRRRRMRFTPLGAKDCLTLLESVLALPVTVVASEGSSVSTPLLQSVRHVAGRYLRATTKLTAGLPAPTPAWWFSPGLPLMLVEYRSEEIATLPRFSRLVELESEVGIRLEHFRISYRGTLLGTWFLRLDPGVNPDVQRRLRLHLFRLHAERECLKQILRLIAQEKIPVESRTPAADRLQEYLLGAQRLLERQSRFGLPQSEILNAAQQFEDVVDEGERETLLAKLSQIRGNIRRFVERYTEEERDLTSRIHVVGSGNTIMVAKEQKIGRQVMTEYNIEFGDHTTFHGDFAVANSIQNSFNKARDSAVPKELQEALKQLSQQVAEMAKHLPPEQARQVAQDLETLTTEATSGKPRKKWYELSAEGLKEAAETVGEIATPVLGTIGKVLAFLGAAAI
jgi:hypothetical protein